MFQAKIREQNKKSPNQNTLKTLKELTKESHNDEKEYDPEIEDEKSDEQVSEESVSEDGNLVQPTDLSKLVHLPPTEPKIDRKRRISDKDENDFENFSDIVNDQRLIG